MPNFDAMNETDVREIIVRQCLHGWGSSMGRSPISEPRFSSDTIEHFLGGESIERSAARW